MAKLMIERGRLDKKGGVCGNASLIRLLLAADPIPLDYKSLVSRQSNFVQF